MTWSNRVGIFCAPGYGTSQKVLYLVQYNIPVCTAIFTQLNVCFANNYSINDNNFIDISYFASISVEVAYQCCKDKAIMKFMGVIYLLHKKQSTHHKFL